MYLNEIKEKGYDVLSKKMNSNKEFKEFIYSKTKFLNIDSTNVCRIWHIKNDIWKVPNCLECGGEVCFSKCYGNRKGYNKYCSHSCKMRHINLNRSKEESEERKKKIRETCIKKYGVEHYFSSKNIKDKKKVTYLKRYGVENPSQIDWVKEKKRETCLINYGVENPSQSSDIQSKKTKFTRKKQITTKCGKKYDLDGYEPLTISELLINNDPKNILHHTEIEDEIGKIYYHYNNKKSVYHPDIYVKSENKIIEVKSLYWYNHSLERNLIKKSRCEELGYDFEFWVYNPKNKLIKVIY